MESLYHIATDLECRVLHFGTEICIAKPGHDVSISLKKGRHKLSFVSTECTLDAYSIFYEVLETDIEDFIEVNLKDIRRSRFDAAAVDLGLSVKWSAFNLGAARPEEYGDYFAWGETEPYYVKKDPLRWREGKENGYDLSSYKWFMGGSMYKITKYCTNSHYGNNGFTDGRTLLDLQDDAAHVNLGGSWRMPTRAEWLELFKECSFELTTQEGVLGYLVIGPNRNSIFLPAIVRMMEIFVYTGPKGLYWSSALANEASCIAWSAFIRYPEYSMVNELRCYGAYVRPVSK